MTADGQRSSNTEKIEVPKEDKKNKGTEPLLKTTIQENYSKILKKNMCLRIMYWKSTLYT